MQVLLLYMSHPASTVRQQVSQLWEKVVQKRSSSGTVLQHNVMQSLMSVVARYATSNSFPAGAAGMGTSTKIDNHWAAMEAALMSLELVLRMMITPLSSSPAPAAAALAPQTSNSKVASGSSPPINLTPGLTPNSGSRSGSSTLSSISSHSIPLTHSHQTPSHSAAILQQMATPASPAERSPKPSPMQGLFS
jgi:hypothetical protein